MNWFLNARAGAHSLLSSHTCNGKEDPPPLPFHASRWKGGCGNCQFIRLAGGKRYRKMSTQNYPSAAHLAEPWATTHITVVSIRADALQPPPFTFYKINNSGSFPIHNTIRMLHLQLRTCFHQKKLLLGCFSFMSLNQSLCFEELQGKRTNLSVLRMMY